MDIDDFEKANKERRRERFDLFQKAFNKAMQEKGNPRTLDDFMGQKGHQQGSPPTDNQPLMEVAMEISDATGMDTKAAMLYALGTCRSIIRHQLAGGTVQFVDADGNSRILKSRVK